MYDTRKAKEHNITIDYILSKVSEYDIYERYLGKFKIGLIYNSPFRKDNNPSFGVYRGRNGNLMFKDHGSNLCGDVIKFVGLIKGISNYNDILIQINKDLGIKSTTVLSSTKQVSPNVEETVIGIVKQPYTDIDIRYWKQFAITLATLKRYNVFSIKYYLCNGIVKAIYKDENPMYAYQVYNRFKVYRPRGDKFTKWRNNLTEYDIQGYAQLPESGNILFITKSLKDVMVLHEMGIPAISPSSESTFIPDDVVNVLLSRFKRIIILFDRDPAGVRNSRLQSRKTGLEAMFVHKKYESKDLSDAVYFWGMNAVKTWLHATLNKRK